MCRPQRLSAFVTLLSSHSSACPNHRYRAGKGAVAVAWVVVIDPQNNPANGSRVNIDIGVALSIRACAEKMIGRVGITQIQRIGQLPKQGIAVGRSANV